MSSDSHNHAACVPGAIFTIAFQSFRLQKSNITPDDIYKIFNGSPFSSLTEIILSEVKGSSAYIRTAGSCAF